MVELTDERVELWQSMMHDMPFAHALENVKEHIETSAFPPAIAEVKRVQQNIIDPEIEARNIEIAHSAWVRAGNDPEAFVYEHDGDTIKRLRA